jgi:SAM-dependent methyltransferase
MTERKPPPSKPATTSRNPTSTSAADWAAARGEKWRDQLASMEAMLAPVDEPLIGALHLDTPCRVADVGCGGGGATLEIARRAPPGSIVHGFDISPALIEAARRRTRPDDRAIAFATADMATAPAPAEPYDRLVSRFGVMFFDDPHAAFANLVRWLAPRGRFAFAVWGRPADNPWMTNVRDVVAKLVDVPSPDPEAPGPFRYADADALLGVLEQAGLGELEARDWRGALPVGGGLPAAEAADFALASFASFGELLAGAGDEALDEARRSLTARFARHLEGGAVRIDACVHVVTGARPAT